VRGRARGPDGGSAERTWSSRVTAESDASDAQRVLVVEAATNGQTKERGRSNAVNNAHYHQEQTHNPRCVSFYPIRSHRVCDP
jgi:hypothetical protein